MNDCGCDDGILRQLEHESQGGFIVLAAEVGQEDVMSLVDRDVGDTTHVAGAHGADGTGQRTWLVSTTLAAETVVDEHGSGAGCVSEGSGDEFGERAVGEAVVISRTMDLVFAHVTGFAPRDEDEICGKVAGSVDKGGRIGGFGYDNDSARDRKMADLAKGAEGVDDRVAVRILVELGDFHHGGFTVC